MLGPWVNPRGLNLFTGGVVAVLVMLSVILTGSVLFPNISDTVILSILIGGSAVGLVADISRGPWVEVTVQGRVYCGAVSAQPRCF